MDREPVQSSNLASVGYDISTSVLEIEFLNGGVYQYYGVPAQVHEGLMNAGSKGIYFNQNIKNGGYAFLKV
jgi:hypothetical protein